MKVKNIMLLVCMFILIGYIYVLLINPLALVGDVRISDISIEESDLKGYQASFDISDTELELLEKKRAAKQITIQLSVINLSVLNVYDLGLRYEDMSVMPSDFIGKKVELHSVSSVNVAPFSQKKLEFRILVDHDLTMNQIYDMLNNTAFRLTKNNGKTEKITPIGRKIVPNINY